MNVLENSKLIVIAALISQIYSKIMPVKGRTQKTFGSASLASEVYNPLIANIV